MVGYRVVNTLFQDTVAAEFKGIYHGLRERLENCIEESFTEGN